MRSVENRVMIETEADSLDSGHITLRPVRTDITSDNSPAGINDDGVATASAVQPCDVDMCGPFMASLIDERNDS